MMLLETLAENYPKALIERYKIDITSEDNGISLLEKVGRKRGMLISGGEVNTERASIMVMDEFRGGKLGRITLETPKSIATNDE
jgi:ribosome biogenesis GTPase A